MSGPSFTDLSKEAAVAGTIAAGTFELIPQAALISPEAFADPKWAMIYGAACSLRAAVTDRIICAESINDHIAFHGLDRELQRAVDSTNTIDWRKWPESADTSLAFGPTTRPLEYCLAELGYLYSKRQAANIGSLLVDNAMDLESAIAGLQALNSINGALPAIVNASHLCSKPPATPPEIIEGVLHQGGKMCFGGGSKSFKTWTLLELSICITTGLPWLGFDTTQGAVLYVNFELPAFAIATRLRDIAAALNIPVPKNLSIWNLRGHAADAGTILPIIAKEAKTLNFLLLVLDPLYKLLGSRDENASRDMADLMNRIEHLGVEINAAISFGSHFAKGNASLKESIDRISGSGVFARDPDSIVTLTQHEERNAFTVDMTLRNFPQQEPFVVRRKHPLMLVDNHLDPGKLKQPKKPSAGRPPEHQPDDLLTCLTTDMTSSEWIAAADAALIPERTYYRLRKELLSQGRIFQSQIDQKWSRK